MLMHKITTVWLTGLSGAGKSTLAINTKEALIKKGVACFLLDGDKMRQGLNSDLGFSLGDRAENIRRVAEVAKMMNEAGLIVIAALISPLKNDRELAKNIIGPDKFIETYLDAEIEICEKRDPKGLYVKARNLEINNFTGISSPYEKPLFPDLTINSGIESAEECTQTLLDFLIKNA